jgi:hypothetical protein
VEERRKRREEEQYGDLDSEERDGRKERRFAGKDDLDFG